MLVGRESEMVTLVVGVQRARAARAVAIVVRGEPGIGKTALLSELEQRASGFRVLKAHGVASESALAYAGLTELLAPVLDLLPRLPGRRRTALEAALGLGDEIVNDPFGAYAATLSLLAEAADEQPVLVLVDDAHLLDAESAHALRFSGRRLTNDRVCLVLAMREGEGVDFEAAGFEQVRVGGLDLVATHALLGETSPAVLNRLHEGTQGNPLALRELGRLLSPAQLQGRDRLPDLLPAGPGITRAFGDRIEALPPATRAALVVAAADGSGQMGTLLEALRTSDLDPDALTPAEVADLITVDAGRLSFVHPLIRTTAYQGTTPARRREAHRALADAAPDEPASRARRAWHLSAATIEPDERVAEELEHVAQEAGTRAAPAIAGRAYAAAAQVSVSGPNRVRRLLHGAQAYHHAGAADAALGLLDTLMSENEDPLIRADAQRLRAQVGSFRDTTGSVRALLVDEAEQVDVHDPVRAALLRLDASMVSMMRGEPRVAEHLSERAWAVAQHARPAIRAYAALVVGGTRVLRGNARSGAALVHEAAEHFERHDIGSVGLFAGQLVFAELAAGRSDFGRERSQRVVDALRAAGTLPTLPSALVGLAWSLMFAGDWVGAMTAAEESVAMAQDLALPAFESQPLTILTLIAGPQGRFAEGRQLVADALSRGLDHGVESIRTMAGWALGRLELSAGALDAAVATLEADRPLHPRTRDGVSGHSPVGTGPDRDVHPARAPRRSPRDPAGARAPDRIHPGR